GDRGNGDQPCSGGDLLISGSGGRVPAASGELFVAGAGTAMRFLTAALALGRGPYRIDGDARLRQRPIAPLALALRALGAGVEFADDGERPPLVVRGPLRGGAVTVTGAVSSQFLSALLLAAPCAPGGAAIEIEGPLVSRPYVDMTLAVMAAFGAGGRWETASRLVVPPGGAGYTAAEYHVEPDASSASYFLAAAAVTGGEVTVEGIGRDSIQGDARFVDVLEAMGARVDQNGVETRVHGPAVGAALRGVDVNLAAMPDTAPTLAAIAPFAASPTRVRGCASLRLKESDRIAALVAGLARLGVQAEATEDGFIVHPGAPHAGEIDPRGDHRLAMAFALVGLRVPGVRVREPECVGKSFPGFWPRWERAVHG
ncbi:MAG: 3-phosphoshikimate 1-carboxyvinyltransferase, partial [Planctomycetes bacterium]|nr:3-phosphoshikimate 1-carboxyvinyltransferase [Planctomycetota bacterium]